MMTSLVLVAVALPLVVEASAELPMLAVPTTVASLATWRVALRSRPSALLSSLRPSALPMTLAASAAEVRLT